MRKARGSTETRTLLPPNTSPSMAPGSAATPKGSARSTSEDTCALMATEFSVGCSSGGVLEQGGGEMGRPSEHSMQEDVGLAACESPTEVDRELLLRCLPKRGSSSNGTCASCTAIGVPGWLTMDSRGVRGDSAGRMNPRHEERLEERTSRMLRMSSSREQSL